MRTETSSRTRGNFCGYRGMKQMRMEENKLELAKQEAKTQFWRVTSFARHQNMAKGLKGALIKLQAKAHKQDRVKALQAAKRQKAAKQKTATNKRRSQKTPARHDKYVAHFNQAAST